LDLSDSTISKIQQLYQSDIRSMINFIQLHQNIGDWNNIIITDEIYEKIHSMILADISISQIISFIFGISQTFNKDKLSIIIGYSQYIIKRYPENINGDLLDIIETVIHTKDTDIMYLLSYFYHSIREKFVANK